MRLSINVPFLVRGAIVALVAVVAGGLLFGPAGFRSEPQSAEAAFLNEVKKLLASDAEAGDEFGQDVAVSDGTAIVGTYTEDGAFPDTFANVGAAHRPVRERHRPGQLRRWP